MQKMFHFVSVFASTLLPTIAFSLVFGTAAFAQVPIPSPIETEAEIGNPQSPAGLDPLQKEATWNLASEKKFVDSIREWMAESGSTKPAIVAAIDAFARNAPVSPGGVGGADVGNNADGRFDRLIAAIASVRPDVAKIARQLSQQSQSVLPPTFSHILDNESEHPFVREHVRLLVGRWLVQNKFYDESLDELGEIEPESVLSPASVLFYRSLAEHQLFKAEACKRTIETLLGNEAELPLRYSVVAKMMLADISPVKDGSLDEISRLMKDVQRRTGLLRSGAVVLEVEEQVIDKLDKLIEEAEKQQQQQQQQAQSQPAEGNQKGARPMDDSKIAGGAGDGKVTSRSIQDGGQWGDMPAAERAAAMAEMVKDMPPHYRSAIEQYFRRLAKEDSP